MKFFKVSKKTPQKTTTYIRYSDGPEGNTVECIAKKEGGTKKVLLKNGDTDGNESLYSKVTHIANYSDLRKAFADAVVEKGFDDEIEPYAEEFAISREIFCAEIVRDVEPHCTPKYNRYYDADTHSPLIGPDFIDNFRSWKSSYHYKNQTIFGFKINSAGLVDFPTPDGVRAQSKRIRSLGVCAVLLAVLGKEDRGGENWGLIEKHNHLQVILIDFGRCLDKMMFAEENEQDNIYPDPFDIVKAVFQPYITPDEPPLPASFLKSAHIKYEIFETIEKLYTMSAVSLEKRAEDNFNQFPLFKAAILQDKKRGIEHLYAQFKDNQEYIATKCINESLASTGMAIRLSELDDETAHYLQSIYNYLKPNDSQLKKELFFKQVQNLFKPELPCEDSQRLAPQSC